MFNWFLKRLKKKEIGNGAGDIFFYRYTLIKCPWFAVYLHQFVRGDYDRCLHDHPWNFISVVLRGGYFEEMKDGIRWRQPGSVLVRPAETAHRVFPMPGAQPWSLVFVGRKKRSWGFLEPTGWKAWTPNYSPIFEDTIDSS